MSVVVKACGVFVVLRDKLHEFQDTRLIVRLDRFWSNQDVLYDYRADLHGIRNRTVVM